MKDECSIVRDLLPLYAEKMVRPATASFVERHLAGCAGCRAELEKEKDPPQPAETDTAPLRALRRKLRAWKVRTVLMTAFLAAPVAIGLCGAGRAGLPPLRGGAFDGCGKRRRQRHPHLCRRGDWLSLHAGSR